MEIFGRVKGTLWDKIQIISKRVFTPTLIWDFELPYAMDRRVLSFFLASRSFSFLFSFIFTHKLYLMKVKEWINQYMALTSTDLNSKLFPKLDYTLGLYSQISTICTISNGSTLVLNHVYSCELIFSILLHRW